MPPSSEHVSNAAAYVWLSQHAPDFAYAVDIMSIDHVKFFGEKGGFIASFRIFDDGSAVYEDCREQIAADSLRQACKQAIQGGPYGYPEYNPETDDLRTWYEGYLAAVEANRHTCE